MVFVKVPQKFLPYRGFAFSTEFPYTRFMGDRFDPAKDLINQERHQLSLSFGDRIFEDEDHLIVPSIRERDREERFKVIGLVGDKLFTGVLSGAIISRGSCP
ncbi:MULTISPECIES: BrnT family toxin [unclassified Rhizobium]|uniref:BrnT family toxin n=1 Tax=unclassified Rhizobium TaxID=2613769 RepID=UPI001FCE2BE5|nr:MULTISPECIES: BrnT family toxin [unclassified Rhizobium]